MEIKPIAIFRSPFPDKFGIPRQAGLVPGLRGRIVFEPDFRNNDAVRGLEGFSYLWLIWGFSGNIPGQEEAPSKAPADKTAFRPLVRPPRLGGNAKIGVFACRSPFRPNGLGLSSVKIESIVEGPVINVLGADLMDGTPIYDIKPYVTYADSHPEAASGFVDTNSWKKLKVELSDNLKRSLSPSQVTALEGILELDPRPQYQDDPEKVYKMRFCGKEVSFMIKDGTLTVTDVTEC